MKFISLVALRILTQIFIMSRSKAMPLEQSLIIDGKGRRYLPLVVSIDEPEVHLHPYMQRSILNYYKQLLSNGDSRFCELLKDLFGIDGLRGSCSSSRTRQTPSSTITAISSACTAATPVRSARPAERPFISARKSRST